MLLAYVDESFSQDWYYMAALLCEGRGVKEITSGLDEVVAKAVRDFGVPGDAELHGWELFHGEGAWQGLAPRARIGVYNDAFEVIASHCQAIILKGIHTAGLARRYTNPYKPQTIVLKDLLARMDRYARVRDKHILVIADEVGEQAIHRSDVALYRQSGTWGYLRSNLEQIIDTIHFAPSKVSRTLQAVDLIVFLYRRMETHTEPIEKAKRANQQLWARIDAKISSRHVWYPSGVPRGDQL